LQVLRHGSYGSGPTTLDVVCWALGIESPKGEMDGSMVAPAYARGEIEEIARYNLADVRATTAVYQNVRDGLLRYRKDW
jgi:predicted PolB exonuclease-like 3'-5' exonuclease